MTTANRRGPLVSICCLTYNHEPYIRAAIEGFLMQAASCPIEVIIHDDASTDGTPTIVAEYRAAYPDMFVSLVQPENVYSQGVRGITARFTFPHARGKYIALCEGDDYWTDRNKLRKQVDLLDAHPEYSGCFHETQQTFEDGRQGRVFGRDAPDLLTTEDTFATLSPLHTSSLVFRNNVAQWPAWLGDVVSGDMALFSIISARGPLKKIPEIMSVYRKHAGSITSLPAVNAGYHQHRIALMNYLDEFHGYKYASKARHVIAAHQKFIDRAPRG